MHAVCRRRDDGVEPRLERHGHSECTGTGTPRLCHRGVGAGRRDAIESDRRRADRAIGIAHSDDEGGCARREYRALYRIDRQRRRDLVLRRDDQAPRVDFDERSTGGLVARDQFDRICPRRGKRERVANGAFRGRACGDG
jgi:hypothetical protein